MIILWKDIQSCDEPWVDLKEAKEMKPVEMKTVGYILEQTEDCVVIASTLCQDGESVGSVNAIPMGTVVSIEKLVDSSPGVSL